MMIKTKQALLGCATALAMLPAAAADYTESILGDLANERSAPTKWELTYGSGGLNGEMGNNVLTGSTGRVAAADPVDRDYVHIVVPQGFQLSQLRVGNQTTVGGSGSFLGLAAGPVMTVAPDAADATGLLGARIYTLADRGTDILDDLAAGAFGASGFQAPLQAGDYTLWIQETSVGVRSYRFNLILTPVPEPGMLAMLGLGLGILSLARRRRG